MKLKSFQALVGAAAVLSACGGDNGGSPPPSSPNSSPQFTSSSSAEAAENTSGAFYSAMATDADSDTLTYTVAGGADSALFSISNSGSLSFRTPPNFEAPADSDGDNVYQITLGVSDGRASANLDIAITVTNVADAVKLVRVANGMDRAITASALATDDLLIIGNRMGHVFEYDPADSTLVDTGSLFSLDDVGVRSRLLTMVASRDYANRRTVSVVRNTSFSGRHLVQVATYGWNTTVWVGRNPALTEEITLEQRPLIQASAARGLDDTNYFLVNDGNEPDRAQEDGLLGNIVNISPPRNPCPGVSCPPGVIRSASGLHSPAGAVFLNDILYFIDRGETRFDEINVITSAESGLNFGWPFFEGLTEVRAGGVGPFRAPFLQYERSSDDVMPFSAMTYYDGSIASMDGKFVIATSDGRFFTIERSALGQTGSTNEAAQELVGEFETDVGELDEIVDLAVVDGLLFVLDGDGELYRAELETL